MPVDEEITRRVRLPTQRSMELYDEAESSLLASIEDAFHGGGLDEVRRSLRLWLGRIQTDRDELADIRVRRACERAELQQMVHRLVRQDNAVLEAQVTDLRDRLAESQEIRKELDARIAWLGSNS